MKKSISNRAFTLIELLAVIVIMMLLLTIAIPSISEISVKSKAKAFFASVSNIVDYVGTQSVFDDKNKCIYYYEYDKDSLPSNIALLYIIVRPDPITNSSIYAVYAEQFEGKRAIDIDDFSNANQNDQNTWINEINSEYSATWVISSLITNFISTKPNNPDIVDYKLCSKVSE